jgi:dihydrofolate synthase/folylpolyglutamate synthase
MSESRRFESLDGWLKWLATLHPKQIDMSLGRVKGVLAALGISDPPYRVVTVAGTNGKGSCVALLEAIYLAAGYRVGAFTSPHLNKFNERIRFEGSDADDETLIEVFESIDAARGELTLSYFEASAVAAMLLFARSDADVAVLEVGMGGRLDAVNAIDADIGLIVSIDLDHMEWLGPDRDQIGREKAGIVRDGCPVIVADRKPPQGLIDEIVRRGGAASMIGVDFDVEPAGDDLEFRASGQSPRRFPRPTFGGRIQLTNAAACVAVVDAMQSSLPVTDEAIAKGLRTARIRGRFERFMIGKTEWIFDVAHNPAAAKLFHGALVELPPVARTIAVFGAMADKDLAAVVEQFVPAVDAWFVGGIDSDRGAKPADLVSLFKRLGVGEVAQFTDVAEAARAAQRVPADRVLVFGSFYTVGPVLDAVELY